MASIYILDNLQDDFANQFGAGVIFAICTFVQIYGNMYIPRNIFLGWKLKLVVYSVYFPELYRQCRPLPPKCPLPQLVTNFPMARYTRSDKDALGQRLQGQKPPPTSQSCDYIMALFFFHSPAQSGLPSKALFFLTCRGAVKNLS